MYSKQFHGQLINLQLASIIAINVLSKIFWYWSRTPWNMSFRYIHCTGQFTPKMKANAEPHLLSSLVRIDLGDVQGLN